MTLLLTDFRSAETAENSMRKSTATVHQCGN
jgi:hypothetical protein